MMMKKYRGLLFIPFFLISGCSGGEDKTTTEQSREEHILKNQVRALEKAKGVELLMQSATEQQRRTIDEQSR